MSLSENAKLQKQVEDLVNEGLIRESLSTCFVPALLTPKNMELRRCALIVEL